MLPHIRSNARPGFSRSDRREPQKQGEQGELQNPVPTREHLTLQCRRVDDHCKMRQVFLSKRVVVRVAINIRLYVDQQHDRGHYINQDFHKAFSVA
jgi:hypothetical protein